MLSVKLCLPATFGPALPLALLLHTRYLSPKNEQSNQLFRFSKDRNKRQKFTLLPGAQVNSNNEMRAVDNHQSSALNVFMALLIVFFSAFLSAFICPALATPPSPPAPLSSLDKIHNWNRALCWWIFLKSTYSFLFNVYGILPLCITVQHVHAWYPQKLCSPETEVTDGCKLPWDCGELNMDPLKD